MSEHDPWRLLNAARAHGDGSEPEHEAGDLQDVVLACFEAMSPEQKGEVFAQYRMVELLEEWGPE